MEQDYPAGDPQELEGPTVPLTFHDADGRIVVRARQELLPELEERLPGLGASLHLRCSTRPTPGSMRSTTTDSAKN